MPVLQCVASGKAAEPSTTGGTGGSGTDMPATQQGGNQANPAGTTPTTNIQNQQQPQPVTTGPGTVTSQPAMPAADQPVPSTSSQQIAQPMVAPGVSGRKMLTVA